MEEIRVQSPGVVYLDNKIISRYDYHSVRTSVKQDATSGKSVIFASPEVTHYRIETQRQIPRVGVLLVGMGGNNGSTVLAGILANKQHISWQSKSGMHTPNWYGSLFMSGTVKLGTDVNGMETYVPISDLLPISKPEDFVVSGWDISALSLGDAMNRAAVLSLELQKQLYVSMQCYKPMEAVYFPNFIAENQIGRIDNILKGNKKEQLDQVRSQISKFKYSNNVDKVIVLWTATTERSVNVLPGVHDTSENLLKAISSDHEEISPSIVYAMASIMEGCSYINGSPQNTFVPGIIELATKKEIFIAGDDLKSGQTKLKSVLVDYLVSSGLKVRAIASYNHLGNNDGYNLSSAPQFRSKEISKSNVIDDIINSNKILYAEGETPDHAVVIKYLPFVGDSKRALDEYSSEIFLGGINTIVVHNTCEDSLLAAPLIIDMLLLTELVERITISNEDNCGEKSGRLNAVLSLLSYMCKAPIVPRGSPVVNSLFQQRMCITNFLKACVGLPPDNHMHLEWKVSK